jgi:hypothetical protein
MGTNEGKKPLGRPRRRWEFNIKVNLQGIGWGDVDWIDMAQNRIPFDVGNFWLAEELLAFQEGLCSVELVIYVQWKLIIYGTRSSFIMILMLLVCIWTVSPTFGRHLLPPASAGWRELPLI